jgi:hypothetical protein
MVRNIEVMYNKFNVEEICTSVMSFSKNMNGYYYYYYYYYYIVLYYIIHII